MTYNDFLPSANSMIESLTIAGVLENRTALLEEIEGARISFEHNGCTIRITFSEVVVRSFWALPNEVCFFVSVYHTNGNFMCLSGTNNQQRALIDVGRAFAFRKLLWRPYSMIDRRATLEHTPITRRLNMANLCVAANRDLALKVRKIEEDIFRQALPLKLLHLAARIQPFGSANVKSNGDSVSVEFKFYQDESLDITLGLETDPWGVQMVENSIVEFEALAEEAKRLTALARNTWDSLTQDQRTALGLQRRP